MKKTFTITFLTFLLALSNFAQTTTNKDIEIKYDKFKDRTTINIKLELIKNAIPMEELYLGLTASFDGKKPTAIPDNVGSFFLSVSTKKQFSTSHSWIFLADDERIKLGDGQYIGDANDTKAAEVILYSISWENLKKIVNAKKVEMQIGSKEFTLTESQLASLKEFYKQIIP